MSKGYNRFRSIIGTVGLVLLVCGLGAFTWAAHKYQTIEMTQDELQVRANDKMPFTSKYNVTVEKVQIDLSQGDIGLMFAGHTKHLGQELALTGTTRGALRYDGPNGTFYFHPSAVQLGDISLNSRPVGDTVNRLIDRLGSARLQENRDAVVEQARTDINRWLTEAVERYLDHHPVYNLQNAKHGTIIHMALTSVEVQPGKVIAHISLWQLVGMGILYAVMIVVGGLLCLVFVIGAATNGGWLPFVGI